MPLYYFKCKKCDHRQRLILYPEMARLAKTCPECKGEMERDPEPPSTQTTETLDNGAMVRKLERLSEAETIHDERARGKKGTI